MTDLQIIDIYLFMHFVRALSNKLYFCSFNGYYTTFSFRFTIRD